jgi:excisionase family DNA binding protein
MTSPYLTFSEALGYSRIPRRCLQRLLREGEIASRKFGRRIVIPKTEIDRYLHNEPVLPDKLLRTIARNG